MPNEQPWLNAGKSDLVKRLYDSSGEPGSTNFEQKRMAILVKCTEDMESKVSQLTGAVRAASDASDRLARIGAFLNAVLVVATLVGAVATVVLARK